MALPRQSLPPQPDSRLPLAEYFWIAGVDDAQLLDAFTPARWSYEGSDAHGHGGAAERPPGETIEEDGDAEEEATLSPLASPTSSSFQRLSRLSSSTPDSFADSDGGTTRIRSNRSSRTILAKPPREHIPSMLISDQDFEKAMDKFTNDRESFFLDLNFNSIGSKSKLDGRRTRQKTQKIVADDASPNSNSMPSRAIGSVRRHLSFKDGPNFKRQSLAAGRRASTKTTRRISTYNAVVPRPEALHTSAQEHPLRRKFEPVLLDKYPRPAMAEVSSRIPFPDYLPMFAFPNDISIISSDSKPRSHWHEFSMTVADNSKIPAVCLIVYVPLTRTTAHELEKRCEEWRKANMTDVEREMAASLAERLAAERAKLSRLLLKLPDAPQGTDAREDLEDEISAVEERISVMADMLRPLRHGAASRIEGLTDGDTGLWIPRAYGLIGRDPSLLGFWRQWLRAVTVPMHDGSILRVPASSPRVGLWQPLERYVHCLCSLAQSPTSSKIQIDLAVRDLHLYAKKEASNELPGSRTTDLYPLFRALTIPNIIFLIEYVLAESRIILLSSHTAMLQLVSKAIIELIWPLKWCGVYIPVLPARLIQALEAPCPYICGVERGYGKFDMPESDFVLVDLDQNELKSTDPPPPLPKHIRRKLQALLHQASPLHHSFGVAPGPPAYAVEAFPYNAFSADCESVFTATTRSTNLASLVGISSSMFGSQAASEGIKRPPTLNVFQSASGTRGKSIERPTTASTSKDSVRPGSGHSPAPTGHLHPPPSSRADSGYALQTSLREKRSGHFDSFSKRNGSISGLPQAMRRKGSLPLVRHVSSPSTVSMSPDMPWSNYAPSMYAQSTLAASTIMPGMVVQPVFNTNNMVWVEAHCLHWHSQEGGDPTCILCNERLTDGFYRCSGCGCVVHNRCAPEISLVCPAAFYPDQIRAAFARCFAGLFYTYKKFMMPLSAGERKKNPKRVFKFDAAAFQRSLPHDNAGYIELLTQTQAFNEFISDRESLNAAQSMQIQLFDNIITAKRNRTGRFRQDMRSLASRRISFGRVVSGGGGAGDRTVPDVLNDMSTHQWRIVTAPGNNERFDMEAFAKGRDYYAIVSRVPGRLEDEFFHLPEASSRRATVRESTPQLPQLPNINGQVGLGLLGYKDEERMKKVRREVPGSRTNLRERLNGLRMNSPNPSQEGGANEGK
ncbi:hypothetical protein DV735_g504, partial [Chaetothyriales sp. CBS 134920]